MYAQIQLKFSKSLHSQRTILNSRSVDPKGKTRERSLGHMLQCTGFPVGESHKSLRRERPELKGDTHTRV